MRIYTNKNAKIIVASDDRGGCPVLKSINKSTNIRDDYGGDIKFPKSLTKFI